MINFCLCPSLRKFCNSITFHATSCATVLSFPSPDLLTVRDELMPQDISQFPAKQTGRVSNWYAGESSFLSTNQESKADRHLCIPYYIFVMSNHCGFTSYPVCGTLPCCGKVACKAQQSVNRDRLDKVKLTNSSNVMDQTKNKVFPSPVLCLEWHGSVRHLPT